MLGRGLFRGAVAQAHRCRLMPTLHIAGCGQAAPTFRTLHCSAHLRGPEHDDFAPISKAVPDTDILGQIEEVRQGRDFRGAIQAAHICSLHCVPRLASPSELLTLWVMSGCRR